MKHYHPEILKLELIEIDTTHSADETKIIVGRSNKFYVVPTEMVLTGKRDLWEKSCPPLVNFEILDCIEEVIASGQYPYNSTVGELFAKKHGIVYEEHSFLGAMVYCTQSYRHSIQAEASAKAFHEKATAEGYKKCTIDDLNTAADTDMRFYVIMEGTNIFGSEVKKKVEKPLKLKNWGDQGPHWMTPQSTRKGWRAKPGQYIKLATASKAQKSLQLF